MQVRSLGQEDSLEKEMVTHSSILAWKIPWADEPSGIQSVGSQRLRHNWANIHTLQEQVQAFLLSLSPFGFCVVFSHFLSLALYLIIIMCTRIKITIMLPWIHEESTIALAKGMFLRFSSSLITFSHTSLVAQMVKASAYNVADMGSILGSGRSPGEGNGNPLQYSCLENPMDGGAW